MPKPSPSRAMGAQDLENGLEAVVENGMNPPATADVLASQALSIDEALEKLATSQAVLSKWMASVNAKIYEFETSYIEETPSGNVIKGWEMDGRPPLPIRSRAIEDKERLFSFSSYSYYTSKKAEEEAMASSQPSAAAAAAARAAAAPRRKSSSSRKRGRTEDDWNALEDY